MAASIRFSDAHLKIIRFCAIECRLQGSGENSVAWMLNAWEYAAGRSHEKPNLIDVEVLGESVEPDVNARGFRRVGVRVGISVKPAAERVPDLMESLIEDVDTMSPAEWFKAFEEVHPFRDGNGRTGAILYNWLASTLDDPEWPPNFWDDPRRQPNAGAPA